MVRSDKISSAVLLLFFSILLINACTKDDPMMPCDTDDINCDTTGQDTTDAACVAKESITSTDTGFYVFEEGQQMEGAAEGIKINAKWEASAIIYIYDSTYNVDLLTFWYDTTFGEYIFAEYIPIKKLPKNEKTGCYTLTKDLNNNNKSSYYSLHHGDVRITKYTLDTTKINRLEVISFDPETKEFKGRFKASYTTDEFYHPEIPERVRFFNVEINIQ